MQPPFQSNIPSNHICSHICIRIDDKFSDNKVTVAVVIFKVARYSFSGPIPPKFEHKLHRHKQSFRKMPPQFY